MSTHNICFWGEIRKISIHLDWKSILSRSMDYTQHRFHGDIKKAINTFWLKKKMLSRVMTAKDTPANLQTTAVCDKGKPLERRSTQIRFFLSLQMSCVHIRKSQWGASYEYLHWFCREIRKSTGAEPEHNFIENKLRPHAGGVRA